MSPVGRPRMPRGRNTDILVWSRNIYASRLPRSRPRSYMTHAANRDNRRFRASGRPLQMWKAGSLAPSARRASHPGSRGMSPTMSKRSRKRRARKNNPANHGRRPNA